MNVTYCDECKKEFTIDQQQEQLKENVTKVYFICPHRDKEYLVYYSNVLIENKRKKIADTISKFEEVRDIDKPKATKLFKKYQALKKEIAQDMDKLEDRVKSWEE